MIRRALEHITRNRPMKTIVVNGAPYMERHYMGGAFGYQVWLHRFLRADSERHLHSHPWTAMSIVLAGWYVEQLPGGYNLRSALGLPAMITPQRQHRIYSAEPGTWTLMVVGPKRLPNWYFIDDQGSRIEVVTSPADWYKTAT